MYLTGGPYMKITNIMFIGEIHKDDISLSKNKIDGLLKQVFQFPYIFDNTIIKLQFELDDPSEFVSFIYRKIFEVGYLRRPITTRSRNNYLMLDLSEVLMYINRATPPILADMIPESTKCISDIIEVLRTFVMEESPSLKTNISILKDVIMMKQFPDESFPNVIDPILPKINYLRKLNISNPMLYIIYSSQSIKDIINNGDRTNISGVIIFNKFDGDIKALITELDNVNADLISFRDNNNEKYLTFNADFVVNDNPALREIINRTYSKLI